MKKLALLFLLSNLCVSAIADNLSLGYCDGNNVTSSLSRAEAVAIRLKAEEFSMYSGSKIIGVRIGMDDNCDKGVRVFLRDRLDGSDIYSFESGALYKGWCDVMFDEPVEFPASDLVVGYETAPGVKPGLSAVDGYCSAEGCFGMAAGRWKEYAPEVNASLCIQLIVEGESYGKTDAGLLGVNELVAGSGAPFVVTGLVRNNTSEVLNELELSLDADGEVLKGVANVAEVLPGEFGSFSFPVEGIGKTGKYEWNLKIEGVGGKPDEFDFNNKGTLAVTLIDELVERKVLVEEFTGQGCSNCPAGKARIDEAIKDLDNVIMVAHHTGFRNDRFTAFGSSDLHFFYNSGNTTYAPAMMVDRMQYGSNPGPVGFVEESGEIRARIIERQNNAAEVAISLKRNYDPDTRNLRLQTAIKLVKGMTVGSNPVLSVFLLENGIIASQEPGFTNYQHDKVMRHFVSAPLGDSVMLTESDSTYVTYDVTIADQWNPDNMEIVSVVSNYDSMDCNNCMVYNAESCPLVGSDVIGSSEIGLKPYSQPSVSAIYNVSGMKMESLQSGLNIVIYSDGSTRKIIKDNSSIE